MTDLITLDLLTILKAIAGEGKPGKPSLLYYYHQPETCTLPTNCEHCRLVRLAQKTIADAEGRTVETVYNVSFMTTEDDDNGACCSYLSESERDQNAAAMRAEGLYSVITWQTPEKEIEP